MLTFKKPVPSKGWMRALLFLIVFTGIYLLVLWLYNQTSLNKSLEPIYGGAGIFAIVAVLTLFAFTRFADKKPILSLGFQWKLPDQNRVSESNHGLLGTLMAIALLGTGWLALYLTGHLEYHGAIFSAQNLAAGFILMCVIAIAEEAVFRGYILNNLLASLNPWLALVISAAIFALLHSGNPEAGVLGLLNVFLAGIFLGIGFIYTRNLWFAVFFHLSWNFLQGPVLGFAVSGLELPSLLQVTISGHEQITGGKFGFEASIIQTVLFLVVTLVLFLFYQNRMIAPISSIEKPAITKQSTKHAI